MKTPNTRRVQADRGREPRWPPIIAIAAAGGLSLALAPGLSIGPPWLFPAIVGVLLVPSIALHRVGRHGADRLLGFAVSAVVTVELIVSVIRLVSALPSKRESPKALLLSAAWISIIWKWSPFLITKSSASRSSFPRSYGPRPAFTSRITSIVAGNRQFGFVCA